jgi:hypothetical protein
LNTPKRTSHHVLERALFTNRPSLNFKPWNNIPDCGSDRQDKENGHTKP